MIGQWKEGAELKFLERGEREIEIEGKKTGEDG